MSPDHRRQCCLGCGRLPDSNPCGSYAAVEGCLLLYLHELQVAEGEWQGPASSSRGLTALSLSYRFRCLLRLNATCCRSLHSRSPEGPGEIPVDGETITAAAATAAERRCSARPLLPRCYRGQLFFAGEPVMEIHMS